MSSHVVRLGCPVAGSTGTRGAMGTGKSSAFGIAAQSGTPLPQNFAFHASWWKSIREYMPYAAARSTMPRMISRYVVLKIPLAGSTPAHGTERRIEL